MPLDVPSPPAHDLDARTRDQTVVLPTCNAAALGVQSSAILRFGVGNLSTTYLTGTLTTMIRNLVRRQPLHTVKLSATILAGLILGAAGGAALVTHARPLAPALQLALLLTVLVTIRPRQRRRASS